MKPPSAIDDSLTRVLLAVLVARRPTVSTCVLRTALPRDTVYRRLHRLRDMGLVAFEDELRGTLRPLVRAYRPQHQKAKVS